MMSKPILGIDVSKLDLSICLLIEQKYHYTKVANNQSGFTVLEQWLIKHKTGQVIACMEATGKYEKSVADFLYQHNHEVSVINPLCIHAFAKSKLSRHKTDKIDSKLIADYASKNDLPKYVPRSQDLEELRGLYRALQKLKDQHIQVQNYLEKREHLPSVVCTSYSNLLQALEQEMGNIQLAIDNLVDNNAPVKQQVNNIQTIPGVGKATAVAVLAETPDLSSFNNARELAAYAGLIPKQKVSGTSVRGKTTISKMGSSRLRKALYFPAIVAKNHNPIFFSLSKKLKDKGKPAKVIIVAIMRKLLHIIFGVVKNNMPFSPHFSVD